VSDGPDPFCYVIDDFIEFLKLRLIEFVHLHKVAALHIPMAVAGLGIEYKFVSQ